jgi:ABC-type multidrug transport system ATPase subunit
VTILLTTHYLDEAERLCDRVAIMHTGEVAGLDRPRALRAALGGEILEFRVHGNAETALAGLRARGVAGEDAFAVGARVTIPLHDRRAGDAVAAIDAEQLRTSELAARAATLDDVYLRLTGARIDQAA